MSKKGPAPTALTRLFRSEKGFVFIPKEESVKKPTEKPTANRKAGNFALWTCIVMLVLAVSSGWPYGYYTLLRWIVCLTTGYLAYEDYKREQRGFALIFGIVALIFNPVLPVHLSKAEWAPIDLVVAGFLFFYVMRGKSIRLKLEKKLRGKLLLWGGVSACFLLVWGVWSQHRYETHDYPISLVTSKANFRPEEYLKSLRGELIVHGWHVKSAGVPDTYLVSFTYSQSPGRLLKALRATRKETAGVDTPVTRGWWWEVNTQAPLVRTVRGDPDLEKKYGFMPTELPPPAQATFLTVDELSQIHLSGEIKEEPGWVTTSRYLLLTIHNGTRKKVTNFRIGITFYDGNFRISERPLPASTDINGSMWNVNILQPGSTANYKVDISAIYPNTQVTRFELKLLSSSSRP